MTANRPLIARVVMPLAREFCERPLTMDEVEPSTCERQPLHILAPNYCCFLTKHRYERRRGPLQQRQISITLKSCLHRGIWPIQLK